MSGQNLCAESLGQIMGHPLGKPSCIYENQCCLMLVDQIFKTLVYLSPDLVGHYGCKRRFGNFNRKIEFSFVSGVYYLAFGASPIF